jgi:hypothetical protein
MNNLDHKVLKLLSETGEFGMPPDDLIELVQANMVGSAVESVMRIRALTELSSHADANTLIALAAAASAHGSGINEMVRALSDRRH